MSKVVRNVTAFGLGMALLLGACASPGATNNEVGTAPAPGAEGGFETPEAITTEVPDTGMMPGTPGAMMDATPGAMMTTVPGGMMGATPGAMMTGSPGAMMTDSPGGMMGATPGAMMTGTPGAMMGGTPGAEMPVSGAEFDQMFIDMMVPHHQSAIEMAKIAQDRSQNPDILRIAEYIITSQQAEIDQLRAWRQEQYGSSETPPMSQMPMLMPDMEGTGGEMQVMDMQAEVEALRQAPEPFDVAFIQAMIPHHQDALNAAELAVQQATHPELKNLAQKILKDQQREIEEMQAILAQLSEEPAATATP